MKRWLAPAAIAGVFAFAYFVTWPCPVRLAFGVPCPACGITRATRLVAHGDFAAATAMHPLVWLVVPVVAAFVVAEVAGFLKTREWGASKRLPAAKVLMLGTAILMFIVWVARFFGAFGGPAPV
ncbi:MAG: DUF2752 domain-containing protein [Deltaproteobacteria bacterium]|nr:DUF2752 domain-containing protein [Deltaproteobacteria bacterium]